MAKWKACDIFQLVSIWYNKCKFQDDFLEIILAIDSIQDQFTKVFLFLYFVGIDFCWLVINILLFNNVILYNFHVSYM